MLVGRMKKSDRRFLVGTTVSLLGKCRFFTRSVSESPVWPIFCIEPYFSLQMHAKLELAHRL